MLRTKGIPLAVNDRLFPEQTRSSAAHFPLDDELAFKLPLDLLGRETTMGIRLVTISYHKIAKLLWFSVLISLFSCSSTPEDSLKHADIAEMENDAYNWKWGDSVATEHHSVAFAGYHLGCSRFDNIEFALNQIKFSCGYRIREALPRQAGHYDGGEKDDGPLEAFEITGVVLLASATQNGRWPNGDHGSIPVSGVLRVAKPVAEIGKPEEVDFEDVSLTVDIPECPDVFDECWGETHLTFIICWDNTQIGARAYQFVRPAILQWGPLKTDNAPPDCDKLNDQPELTQGLAVYRPLLDKYAKRMDVAPDPENWTAWIDEALPRP